MFFIFFLKGIAIDEAKKIDCEMKTLSSLIRERNLCEIDFLKIDVEGSELLILKGIKGLIYFIYLFQKNQSLYSFYFACR